MRALRLFTLVTAMGLVAHSTAFAFTFVLYSGSTDQVMTWRTGPSSGSVFSVNSEIPLYTFGNKAGGMLDWTASSGRLTVVAMPVAWMIRSVLGGPSDSWGSVDARTPPSFLIIPESGDQIPFSVDLLIRVRILGTLEQYTGPSGLAQTVIHMTQAVSVNGVTVTSDALDYDNTVTAGVFLQGPVSFPKGTLNNVVVPGVSNGSILTIPIWAYMRGIVTNVGTIDAYGPYGDGLAVEIDIRNANAVDVPETIISSPLSLSARPNPASGPARIQYSLPRSAQVRLSIYDVTGHRASTLVDRLEDAGPHAIEWNGRSSDGERLAPGLYWMELIAGNERRVAKLALLGR